MNSDDTTNVQKTNEEEQMNSLKNDGDVDIKHSIQDKLDVHVHHFDGCNDINDSKLANFENLERNKLVELEDDEHDDFDDLEEEEEDLHAGENFWCSLCDDGGNLLL